MVEATIDANGIGADMMVTVTLTARMTQKEAKKIMNKAIKKGMAVKSS